MTPATEKTEVSSASAEAAKEQPETTVFAVHGAEPEVLAYAMAKYSRSALSMRESLREISGQKAEQFLNTFYFEYGHRSIADLAHIAMAIERLSLLAAIAVVDEQRWDGQERSTRYQDFRKSGYFVPDSHGNPDFDAMYRETADFLFAEYEVFSQAMAEHLATRVIRPSEMKPEAFTRTIRARAFDISRYLLPLATNTSLGEIVNARTLETQISRLLTHSHAEVRQIGLRLKEAARQPAFNPQHEPTARFLDQLAVTDPDAASHARAVFMKEVPVAPTLVKYANANTYERETRHSLAQAAREIMGDAPVNGAPLVDLLEDEPLEVEVATTLLYGYCHYSYRQIREQVGALPEARRSEIIDLGLRYRGPHDEVLRPLASGQKLRFDILMDVGGFRDMHRHRRCIQIGQDFATLHGFDMPEDIAMAGLGDRYRAAMERADSAITRLGALPVTEAAESAQYLIPLAWRKRTLFKMDFAEALYIAELRTTAAGHWSYRNVAYAMYEALQSRHPMLAKHIRITDVHAPVDLLKR